METATIITPARGNPRGAEGGAKRITGVVRPHNAGQGAESRRDAGQSDASAERGGVGGTDANAAHRSFVARQSAADKGAPQDDTKNSSAPLHSASEKNDAARAAGSHTVAGEQPQRSVSDGTHFVAPSGTQSSDPRAAMLCNITDQSWVLHRTHGTFTVRGCAPDEPYALTAIGDRRGSIDLGDKRTLEFGIAAREIADDLAHEINSDGGEQSDFGVFVCAGETPSPDELAAARARLETFYRALVAAADRTWQRTHNVVLISDLERRAARALRLEKEWSYEPGERIECPACGEKLRPGVAVCRVCRAVLDKEKAAAFGLAQA